MASGDHNFGVSTAYRPVSFAATVATPRGGALESDAVESDKTHTDDANPRPPQPVRIETDCRRPGTPEGPRDYPTLGYE